MSIIKCTNLIKDVQSDSKVKSGLINLGPNLGIQNARMECVSSHSNYVAVNFGREAKNLVRTQ